MKNILLVVARGLIVDERTSINGPERRTYNSIDFMNKHNYYVAYSRHGYFYKGFKNKIGLRLVALESFGIKDFLMIYRLYKIIKELNINIVHVQGPFASDFYVTLASRLAGAKAIITRPIIISTDSDSFMRKVFMRIFDKIIFFLSSRLVTISEKSKRDWLREGAPSEKVHVVYNGTFLNKFNPSLTRKKHTKTVECVMVGQFTKEKNQLWFLEHIALYLIKKYNIFFTFVGDGHKFDSCVEFIKDKKISNYVHLTGNIDNVNDIINKADISFLSSKKEGVPVALIESISSGIPIIANDVASVSEVCVNNVNGFLLKVDDITAWLNAFEKLIKSEQLRKAFGENGRKLAKEKFDIFSMIEKYEQIYETT